MKMDRHRQYLNIHDDTYVTTNNNNNKTDGMTTKSVGITMLIEKENIDKMLCKNI